MRKGDVNLFIADDIGCNEFPTALLIKSLDSSIFDTRELTYHGLYLFKFDAEATNLDLPIATAHKLDVAVS